MLRQKNVINESKLKFYEVMISEYRADTTESKQMTKAASFKRCNSNALIITDIVNFIKTRREAWNME